MRLLRKIIQPLRYSYMEYRHAANGGVSLPDGNYMGELSRLLHPVDFSGYRTEHGLGASFLMLHTNVGETTQFIKRAADLLSSGQMVPVEDLQKPATVVSLDEWLTVSQGHYVNPVEGLAGFVAEVRRLLAVVKAHEGEKVGVHAASWRQMRMFYIGLQSLLVGLVVTSHECLKA